MSNPSKYAGITAALVFGLGLLLTGRIEAGIFVLGLAAFVLAFTLAPSTSGKALFTAFAALVCSAVLVYNAVSNEVTGRANYYHSFGKGSRAEPVTREEAPAKFREATNLIWAGSLLCGLVGIGLFAYCRKADDEAEDFF